jgi:ketosteroid isomerase-like protein
MSNLDSVQAIYAAFGAGNVPAILTRLADDVDWESWSDNRNQAAAVPWFERRRGRDAVAGFFEIIGTWQVNGFQVVALLEGGNQVGAEIEVDFTLPSGQQLRDEELHLWTFGDDGKVTHFRHYVDTAKHIAAAQPS